MQLPPTAPLALWPSLLAVQGPGEASDGHEHHTFHLVLARSGHLTVCVRDGQPRTAAAVLTRPDVPHAISCPSSSVLLLFVDPESESGDRLHAALGTDELRLFDTAERTALLGDLPDHPSSAQLDVWMRGAIDRLAGPTPVRRTMHPRVRRLLRLLRELPSDADSSLETLAAQVDLSPSRLLHVFTESVGVPLRTYLRWLRVQRAAASIVQGMPLTQAAAEAGFADAAHMSRTFKQMFGLAPSALQRRSQFVQASAGAGPQTRGHADEASE